MTPEGTSNPALASPPEPSESRRSRIRATIRMAAQMVEKGDPNARLISEARVAPLDSDGNVIGEWIKVGPLTVSMTLTDVDPEMIRTLIGEA